jgi:hypothetical protein
VALRLRGLRVDVRLVRRGCLERKVKGRCSKK